MKQTEKNIVKKSLEQTRAMVEDILNTWVSEGEFVFSQATANKLSVVSGRLEGIMEAINLF